VTVPTDQSTPLGPHENTCHMPIHTVIYLVYSAASGFIELGAIFLAVRMHFSIVITLGLGLVYQAGALLTNPLKLTGSQYRVMIALAVFAGVATVWEPYAVFPSLFLLSAGLQGLREEALEGSRVGTFPKRVSRILGFALAGFFSPWRMVIISLLILLFAAALQARSEPLAQAPRPVQHRSLGITGIVMVMHQMHYFVYSYALPVLFFRTHGLGGVVAGLAFALGWVSYSLTPMALGRLPPLPVVVIGHVTVAVTLAFMAANLNNLPLLLAAWFASGFGGGTVFGIRSLGRRWASVDRTGNLDMWENVGHVLGVLAAITLMLVAPHDRVLFLAGAAFAMVVAGTVALTAYFRRISLD